MFRLWSRLSLRIQAMLAVLVPCVAVAVFASLYFPSRLNAQATASLEEEAQSLGQLAAIAAVAVTEEENDSDNQRLDALLESMKASAQVSEIGVFRVRSDELETDRDRLVLNAASHPERRLSGNFPLERFVLPNQNDCELSLSPTLFVRCLQANEKTAVLLVARRDSDWFEQLKTENRRVGLRVLAAAASLAFLLAWWFSGALTRSLSVISEAAGRAAAGDVSVSSLEVGGALEVQSMATSVNQMVAEFQQTLKRLTGLSGELGGAAAQLKDASLEQANVTRQQSVFAHQIGATFDELTKTADSINRSTALVEEAAIKANAAVGEVQAFFSRMVDEIKVIQVTTGQVSTAIGALNQDLRQVSQIASTIRVVADRTDLLALNASLEGTKAGEVGKGFGVVAGEMRKVSESILSSARDIAHIIERVQQSGVNAQGQAEAGVDASGRGAAVAEKATAAFAQMLEFSKGTKEAAQRIASAARQQRQSSEQAVQGAKSINELVRRGVDATNKTVSIAGTLQDSVGELTSMAVRFQLEDTSDERAT